MFSIDLILKLTDYYDPDKLSCDIHPRKMIKMVRRVSRDHIIINFKWLECYSLVWPEFYNVNYIVHTPLIFNFICILPSTTTQLQIQLSFNSHSTANSTRTQLISQHVLKYHQFLPPPPYWMKYNISTEGLFYGLKLLTNVDKLGHVILGVTLLCWLSITVYPMAYN